jgi:hypothetical protein
MSRDLETKIINNKRRHYRSSRIKDYYCTVLYVQYVLGVCYNTVGVRTSLRTTFCVQVLVLSLFDKTCFQIEGNLTFTVLFLATTVATPSSTCSYSSQ